MVSTPMKTLLRKRYYCDFCKKGGASAFHMRRHEVSCTLNPNRACRVCKMYSGNGPINEFQKPITELLSILPEPEKFPFFLDDENQNQLGFTDALGIATNAVLPELRKLVNNCPACIMAALRQKKIPIPMVTDFDFTKEMRAIWDKINDAKNGECGGPY